MRWAWALLGLIFLSIWGAANGQVLLPISNFGGPRVLFQGPGNLSGLTSGFAWYACARAFSSTYATTTKSLCEVQRNSGSGAPDNTKCTIVSKSNGFADQTAANCNSNTQTISQFCNVSAWCGVDKMFDQSGNGRDVLQATQANQPTLTLSGAGYLNNLPTVNCGNGTSVLLLATAANVANTAQPFVISSVLNYTSTASSGGFIGGNSTGPIIGSSSTAGNLFYGSNGAAQVTASQSTWHAFNGYVNGTSGGLHNLDGSTGSGENTGTTGFSAETIRVCRAQAQVSGFMAEGGVWAITSDAAHLSSLNSNQHGTNGYNF